MREFNVQRFSTALNMIFVQIFPPQARNISCWVQFKSSDVKGAKALPVIYSSAPGTVFCDGLHTTVLHHCTSPTFYTEV